MPTEKKDIEKLNLLFEFLNDLSSQIVKKQKETSESNTKEIVGELYELITDFKNDIGNKIASNNDAFSKLKIEPKIQLEPSFKFPDVNVKVLKFPEKMDISQEISVLEVADVLDLLSTIAKEIQKKELTIDLTKTERAIGQLQEKLQRGVEDLIFAIPKRFPELPMEKGRIKVTMPEFPMEQGRIKVILPKDQVEMRTPLGEKIKKGITGVFLGGETPNRVVGISGKDGKQINPAEDKRYTIAMEYDVNNNPIYIGEADIGSLKAEASWRIKKLIWDINNNMTDQQWAEANDNFNKIWNNRATYAYS